MNKKVDFILCLFLGYIGIHKFYENKIGLGVLYLFTLGIFGIGWIYDCIVLGINLLKTKSVNTTRKELEDIEQCSLNMENNSTDVIEQNTIIKNEPISYSNYNFTNKKITKIEKLSNAMNPSPVWNDGSDAQQEFATNLVDEFCDRFAKYLTNGIKDHIIDDNDADNIVNLLWTSINEIDDSKWWCNKKNTNDFIIASKLLEDDELQLNIIKKLKKQYN